MEHKTSSLNGDFGILIEPVTRRDLGEPAFQRHAYDLWSRHGGLLALRGDDLTHLTPEELVGKRSQGGDEGVVYFSVKPGEIRLTSLERTGEGIDQYPKGGLTELPTGLAQ